ncbi:MAG TPA: hypothetical protein VKT81_19260 [Bryobacteraceae bacterium]|nr:hypothetical protein [Bryobacteraceae bacterium]
MATSKKDRAPSVRFVGREMRESHKYWQAYEQWKKLHIKLNASAATRFTREEAHERRC